MSKENNETPDMRFFIIFSALRDYSRNQMRLLIYLLLLVSVLAYEKIDIFSDHSSLMKVTRDNVNDKVIVESETRIALGYKTTVSSDIEMPKELMEFQFSIVNPETQIGRYILEIPYEGVHFAFVYKEKQELMELCDIFERVLPCFNVLQCSHKSMIISVLS